MKKVGVFVIIGMIISLGAASAGLFGDIASIGAPKYSIVRAPEFVLPGVKTIGVGDFKGRSGEIFAGALLTAIKEPKKLGPEPKGNAIEGMASGLVEGAASQATGGMSQLVTGAVSGLADLGKAPMYEKGLNTMPFTTVKRGTDGVDAIVYGTMDTEGPSDSNYTAERIKINAKGEKTKEKVSCQKREAKLTVRMNIKTPDGNILASKDMSTGLSATKCEGDGKSLPSGDAMFNQMAKKFAPAMAVTFCPYYNVLDARLQKDKKTKPSVKIVNKEKNWDKGVAVWSNFVQADPYQYASLYNLGMANLTHGNYDKAKEWFEKAEMAKSHRRNKRQIKKCEARKVEVERLKGYDMAIVPHQFAAVSASTMVIKIKGKSKNRYPIFQEPNETAAKVMDLPGGMIVDLITMQGEWYKVKTKDGKFEGWILKKNLSIKE